MKKEVMKTEVKDKQINQVKKETNNKKWKYLHVECADKIFGKGGNFI